MNTITTIIMIFSIVAFIIIASIVWIFIRNLYTHTTVMDQLTDAVPFVSESSVNHHRCSYCGTIHDKSNCPNCGGL